VGTVIQYQQRANEERQQRWERIERAELCAPYGDLHAQGPSQRQAATVLARPRSTRQAWQAYAESIDACPTVVAFFPSVPGLAFLHRLVIALHLVCVEIGACGMRLVCLVLDLTGLNRFVGTSYGTPQRVNCRVEAAMVAYRREESARLAQEMPPTDITVAQDATFTGGLCLSGIEARSHSMLLEQVAQARAHDPWHRLLEQALSGLNCQVMPSTSDEAPGLLAYVAHHLGAPHSPDLCHVQHALSKAVSAPMAATQRAAAQAVAKAAETCKRRHERLAKANGEPAKRAPGRPPQTATSLEQVEQNVEAARHAHQRLAGQRETVPQSLRAIGHASHFVDVERGVRRNGKRIAGDIQCHSDTIRTIAQPEHLSEPCLERIEKAERVVPTMQATIAFVSGYGRQQGRQLDVAPPASYAVHAHLIPAFSLERVASTRTMTAGAPLRALAERLRPPLFAPDGTFGA
jgi:hypothetical protein